MLTPIADPRTGTVAFPQAGKKVGIAAEKMTYVAIPESKMAALAELAQADGFVPDAETDKGVQQQTTKACRTYILMGIDRLLMDREATE